SASLAQRFSPVRVQSPGANLLGAPKVSVGGARQEVSANLNSLSVGRPAAIAPFALMPQATPTPSIATFDGTGGTCGAAKAEFNLGQEVCATATGTGGSAASRRTSWQDPDGFVSQSTAITTDPQSDN